MMARFCRIPKLIVRVRFRHPLQTLGPQLTQPIGHDRSYLPMTCLGRPRAHCLRLAAIPVLLDRLKFPPGRLAERAYELAVALLLACRYTLVEGWPTETHFPGIRSPDTLEVACWLMTGEGRCATDSGDTARDRLARREDP